MSHTSLVTGCAGFIGSHLTDRLLAAGHSVIGIDSFEDYYARAAKEANLAAALEHAAFRFHEANLVDIDLSALVAETTCVYHLAAQAGVRASWGASFEGYTRNNVRYLNNGKIYEVPNHVFLNSWEVLGNRVIVAE